MLDTSREIYGCVVKRRELQQTSALYHSHFCLTTYLPVRFKVGYFDSLAHFTPWLVFPIQSCFCLVDLWVEHVSIRFQSLRMTTGFETILQKEIILQSNPLKGSAVLSNQYTVIHVAHLTVLVQILVTWKRSSDPTSHSHLLLKWMSTPRLATARSSPPRGNDGKIALLRLLLRFKTAITIRHYSATRHSSVQRQNGIPEVPSMPNEQGS